jgi:hypothetical protein
MAKTPDQKRDDYYRKKYGVGLDWYNARLVEQGHKCGICRRPQEQFSKRMAVDHDHSYKKPALETWKDVVWFAAATYLQARIVSRGKTKNEAKRNLRRELKAKSCRGLLCPWCNRGLRYYADCPNRLQNAAIYLRKHQNA